MEFITRAGTKMKTLYPKEVLKEMADSMEKELKLKNLKYRREGTYFSDYEDNLTDYYFVQEKVHRNFMDSGKVTEKMLLEDIKNTFKDYLK